MDRETRPKLMLEGVIYDGGHTRGFQQNDDTMWPGVVATNNFL